MIRHNIERGGKKLSKKAFRKFNDYLSLKLYDLEELSELLQTGLSSESESITFIQNQFKSTRNFLAYRCYLVIIRLKFLLDEIKGIISVVFSWTYRNYEQDQIKHNREKA